MKAYTTPATFLISLFVTHWNNCSDLVMKKTIREKISQDDSSVIKTGMDMLEKLIRNELAWHQANFAGINFDEKIIAPITSMLVIQPASYDTRDPEFVPEVSRQVNLANTEIVSFFIEMFTAGYFEKIPVPMFYLGGFVSASIT